MQIVYNAIMDKYPQVTVLIITYNRPKEIRMVIDNLLKRLHYDGRMQILIQDDHSGGTYLSDLESFYKPEETPPMAFSSTPKNGGGATM